MNGEEHSSHNVSAEWGDGTSWVLQMNEQQGETSSESDMVAEQEVIADSQVSQEVEMNGAAKPKVSARVAFQGAQNAQDLWEELYDWCLRVRRDILCLEAWAMQNGYKPCGKPDDPRETTENMIRVLSQIVNGDPGDPPGGPFDSE
jgi:hypothetical protein